MINTDARKALLRLIRSHRSQMYISKKLGYTFNKMSRWEDGSARLSWSQFVCICRVCKISLAPVFRQTLFRGSIQRADLLLSFAMRSASSRQASRLTGLSRHKIERWLKCNGEPTLEEMLTILDRCLGIGSDVVIHTIRGHDDLDNPLADLKQQLDLKKLTSLHPYHVVIDWLFATSEYQALPRHQDGFVAKRLKITLKAEREVLRMMEKIGVIEWTEEKYRPSRNCPRLNTAPLTITEEMAIQSWWVDRYKKVLHDLSDYDGHICGMGYRVTAVSSATFKKIRKKQSDFYHEIGQLIAEDRNNKKDVIRVIQYQIFDPFFCSDAGDLQLTLP